MPDLKINVTQQGAQQTAAQVDAVAKSTEKVTQATEKSAVATKKIATSAKEADDAFAKLGGRNNDAKDVLEGIEGAARGGAGAIFNIAKAWKGLVGVFTAFNPLSVVVAIATALVALAPKFLPAKKSAEDLAKELEEVRKKADELAAARLKSFEDQLKAISLQADEATRNFDLLANARERISDAITGKQVSAINADPTLTDEQKSQQVEAVRRAREKEKADNEIKDQRAKLKIEQEELKKQQDAGADGERAAKAAREKVTALQGDERRLKEIPDELVNLNERVRAAGGGDFQVEQATRPLRDERRQLSQRLANEALKKAEAEAATADQAVTKQRQSVTPQFQKVQQLQQALDTEVATRARLDQIENTKGPITPRLKNELLRGTTNDIFNNGNSQSRDGSGGFINGEFVGAPRRAGEGTINGQPLRNALTGPNSVQRTGLDEAAQEIKDQPPADLALAGESATRLADAVIAQTQASQQSVDATAAQITAKVSEIPPPLDLAPILQSVSEGWNALSTRDQSLQDQINRVSQGLSNLAQRLQSVSDARR